MSFKFQLPPITADMSVDRMRSYLMQMQDQLEYALNNLETSNFTETTKQELSKNSAAISQEVVEASEEVSKAFVLKNAEEIREEMQTYVQSITGQYEAISEQFGTYREETDLKIETNANGITQNYNKVTALETSTNNAIAATNAEVTSQGDVIDATTAWKRLTQAYIKTGLLYYEGLTPVYGIAIGQINIDENDPEEQASKLFACLRECDKDKNIRYIYARMPQKNGVGLAVYNRLIKAAGFKITEL